MAFPRGGACFPSCGDLGDGQRPPSNSRRKRPNNEVDEVVDLSSSPEPCSTATSVFAGAKLSDFTIGDRLGATRDGGEGFQGCNSRVFRATLRRQNQSIDSLSDDTARGQGDSPQHTRPASTPAPSPLGVPGQAAKGGHHNGTPTRQRRSFAGELRGLGEQVWKGSFGACISGNSAGVLEGDGDCEAREEPTSGKPRASRGDAEWAIKMALTYAGQDPLQAARDMETEIDILVGRRIPPHDNIMRGVHSFEDEIGEELQPVLWDGLGPEDGRMLSSHTFFVVMPLFTAGSLQALLNKRQLRCKGPPFLRLLDTMRFAKQMLSAVSHLLAHGIAHNDIKPDNWLLRANQSTLVLTDFGAAVDSSRPKRQIGSSSPAAPALRFGTAAATAATGPREPVFTSLPSARWQSKGAEGIKTAAAGAGAGVGVGAGAAAAGASSGEAGNTGHTGEEAYLATSTAPCQPVAKRALSVSERLGLTGKRQSGIKVDEVVGAASPARKRRRHGVAAEGGGEGDDRLLLPFSEYCATGTPSVIAPELQRAWREEKDLDFRRSDVFSVGVCMYRMLRPDSVYVDNGTGLEGKDPLEKIEGRVGQHAWPLLLFPENKGGCPYEVAQLCRGLLQSDPVQRLGASEGESIASCLVSHLETADKDKLHASGAVAPAPGSDSTVTSRSGSNSKGPPMASGGVDDARMQPGGAYSRARTHGASVGKCGRIGSAIAPFDMTTPPLPSGSPRVVGERGRDDIVPSGDAGWGGLERGVRPEQAGLSLDTAARKTRTEGERWPEEPNQLVRCDRISHMRDVFARAAPEDLFHALDSKGWDVAAACGVFVDGNSGKGASLAAGKPASDFERTCVPGGSQEHASTQGGPSKLWFDSVVEELKGRRRQALALPRRRQSYGSHG